jgi:hypothetical protein
VEWRQKDRQGAKRGSITRWFVRLSFSEFGTPNAEHSHPGGTNAKRWTQSAKWPLEHPPEKWRYQIEKAIGAKRCYPIEYLFAVTLDTIFAKIQRG